MAISSEQPSKVASQPVEKGLKTGALGLVSSIVIGVASTAPAYSLAATLGFIVIAVGIGAPMIIFLAFIPMFLVSLGYNELNKADPDCGTTFTWGTKTFGPKTGWMGGWAIIAADVLCMASLAQVSGQYVFLLFNQDQIGADPAHPLVLLVGCIWMALMTWVCWAGIEISANLQKVLLAVETVILIAFGVVATVKVLIGNGVAESIKPDASWLNPFSAGFSPFVQGIILMLFIYWGWDSCLSVNEETKDSRRTPGKAAIWSTVILVATYLIATVGAQSIAGVGEEGIGLGNENNAMDVFAHLGTVVFGEGAFGQIFSHLLILMVLTSAAASTQTTILPTARTTLAMAAYEAFPKSFAKISKHLTPSVSTIAMGGVSLVLYIGLNFLSGGLVIADAVTAIGLWIAFYYGLTAFTCVWFYRKTLRESARNLWIRGILPGLGGVIMYLGMAYCVVYYFFPGEESASWTTFTVPFTHLQIGGAWVIAFISVVVGILAMLGAMRRYKAFFAGKVLTPDAELAEYMRED